MEEILGSQMPNDTQVNDVERFVSELTFDQAIISSSKKKKKKLKTSKERDEIKKSSMVASNSANKPVTEKISAFLLKRIQIKRLNNFVCFFLFRNLKKPITTTCR